MSVYEGRAVAHGRNIPYLPILELFRAYFGITAGDDDRSAREKIAGRLMVLDATFAEAQHRFDEREIAELVLLNAIENFYNGMNLALGIDEGDGLEELALRGR